MDQHVCDHLRALEDDLISRGVKVTYSGQPWTKNCRFWITFAAVLDCDALRKRFSLPDFVSVHEIDDTWWGREKGLVCDVDHDAIIGRHPLDGEGYQVLG